MSWLAGSSVTHALGENSVGGEQDAVRSRSTPVLRPFLKRSFDVVAAGFALLAVLPILVLIAIAIKLDSRGPVFYRVRRVGYRGEPLMMLKFRKMFDGATGIPLTGSSDPRLTRVGGFLAATRLDELPQLWDVLRGRMSLIGPRPEDPSFVALHPEAFARVLRVRPGMTGLSQLAYADERSILDALDPMGDYAARVLPQKLALDALYADSYRLSMDLCVIWWTLAAVVLRRSVAVHRTSGRMSVRRRERAVTEEVAAAVVAQLDRRRDRGLADQHVDEPLGGATVPQWGRAQMAVDRAVE